MYWSTLRRTDKQPSAAPSSPSKRTLPYMKYITAISQRTGTPLPSLILSFGILHEITAVVPLVGFFFGSRWLGIGEKAVEMASEGRGGERITRWFKEGEAWAARKGRRYGIWGFEKTPRGEKVAVPPPSDLGVKLAGDVANAIVAYALTKAIIPFRIALSLYYSPSVSRSVVEPTRKAITRLFYRG